MKNKKALIFVIIVYLVAFCTNMGNSITGPMLNDVINHYGIGLAGSGTISSLQNVGSVLTSILFVLWLKRYNRARLFLVPALVIGCSAIFMGLAPQYGIFVTLYFTMGVGIAFTDVLANALIPDLLSDSKTAALSILHGMAGLGAVTLAIFSGVLLDSGAAWNRVYSIVGICMLVLAIAIAAGNIICGKEILPMVTPVEEKGSTPIKVFLIDKMIWLMLVIMILYAAAQSTVAVWMPQYCKEVFGSTAMEANGALIAYWSGAAPVRILYGTTGLKKLDTRKVLIYGNVLSGIALLIGLVFRSYWAVIISIWLFGVLNAVAIPLIISIANSYYPSDSSMVSSAMILGLYIATIIITVVVANCAFALGMNSIFVIAIVLVIASGLLGICIKSRSVPDAV